MVKAGEKGSREAVLTRRDGSKLIINRDNNRVVREINPSGKQVIRVDAKPNPRGGSGKVFRKVDNQKEVELSRRIEQNNAIRAENERIMREGNISLEGGGVGKVTYTVNDPLLQTFDPQVANISTGPRSVGFASAPQISQPRTRVVDRILPQDSFVRQAFFRPESREAQEKLPSAQRSINRVFFQPEALDLGVRTGVAGSGLIGIPSGQGVRALGILGRTSRVTPQFLRRAKRTDTIVQGGLKNIGFGFGVAEGAKQVGILTTPRDIRSSLQESGVGVRQAERELFLAGQASRRAALSGGAPTFNVGGRELSISPKGIVGEFNPLLLGREEFRKGVVARGVELGLSPQESLRLGTRSRQFRGIGEGLGIFSLNVGSEFIGTGLIARSNIFNQGTRNFVGGKVARSQLFKTGFRDIGTAGVIEGIGDVAITTSARSEELRLRDIGIGGALGGASAGLLGGGIIATQAGRKGTSRGLYAVGSVLDPFEFPADKTADLLRRVGFDSRTPLPIIRSKNRKGQEVFNFGTITQSPRSRASAPQTRSRSRIPTVSFTSVNDPGNIFNPSINPTVTNAFSQTFSLNTPQAFSQTNVVGQKTTTPVNVPSVIPSLTPATIVTPRLVLPPPLLPFGFPGGAGGGVGRKKKSKFVDELNFGLNFLRGSAFSPNRKIIK